VPRSAPPPLRRRLAAADHGTWLLLPLRAFLGITFVYAGLQKLADRWFLKASAPASLQSQLRGAARTSPIGGLVSATSHYAVVLGVLIAFAELAIGLGTLVGLWARVAAGGGLLLSLAFLLTVSWHSRPYYYGADVVFVFAWTPLLLGGAGRWSIDAVAAARARAELGLASIQPVSIGFDTVQGLCGFYDRGRCAAQRGRRCSPEGCPVLAPAEASSTVTEVDRRTFLTRAAWAGWIGAGAVVAGGFTAAAGRLIAPAGRRATPVALSEPGPSASTVPAGSGTAAATTAGPTTPTSAATGGPTTASSAPTPATPATGASGAPTATAATPATAPATAAPPAGTRIGPASVVPVGGAASFADPTTGDPAFVVQPSSGRFVAFDGACTHQGCPVQFAGTQFECPCHGAVFDSSTGAVIRGPARRPLRQIPIQEGSDGELYVQ